MRAHEAGALHAEGYGAPSWLAVPEDPNALVPALWASGVHRAENGALSVAGVDVRDLAEEFGTPAYVLDENDFRTRARSFAHAFQDAFADACGGADVYYAGKAFLCTQVAKWIAEEGLRLDTCTGTELAVALRAGVPPERIGLHGNNKSDAEHARALDAGIGRIVVDSLEEIDRLAAAAQARGVQAPVLLRITVGVEAHTHSYIATAHEDQKFGISLSNGDAERAVAMVLDRP
ncbi:MAG TPA: diaminopimelate decarboxylase, partial [Actinomycetales bacterium]|nr:diaminopimelate decarboxylase [Actinomycetales bacterium]